VERSRRRQLGRRRSPGAALLEPQQGQPRIPDKLPIWWGEYFTNAATQWAMGLQRWLPSVSTPPSPFASSLVQSRMKDDMRAVVGLPDQADRFFGRKGIDLFVGAVDVVNPGGEPQTAFRTFPDQPELGLRLDELLASACIPELFIATPLTLEEDQGLGPRVFWDGLYSQNPPINDFFDGRSATASPTCCGWCRSTPTPTRGGLRPADPGRAGRPAQRAGRQPVAGPGAARHRR
jgi:hypothetical protein